MALRKQFSRIVLKSNYQFFKQLLIIFRAQFYYELKSTITVFWLILHKNSSTYLQIQKKKNCLSKKFSKNCFPSKICQTYFLNYKTIFKKNFQRRLVFSTKIGRKQKYIKKIKQSFQRKYQNSYSFSFSSCQIIGMD